MVAERQTAGRGRLGRQWESPPRAGLAVSVLLRPGPSRTGTGRPRPPPRTAGCRCWPAWPLVEAVTRLAELDAALKWPNDLLRRRRRKCAGILAEAVPDVGAAPAIVVGVGLNVTLRADELPVNPTGLPATSLQLAGATATDRDPLLRALLRGFADWYDRWQRGRRRRRGAAGCAAPTRSTAPPSAGSTGAAARRRASSPGRPPGSTPTAGCWCARPTVSAPSPPGTCRTCG